MGLNVVEFWQKISSQGRPPIWRFSDPNDRRRIRLIDLRRQNLKEVGELHQWKATGFCPLEVVQILSLVLLQPDLTVGQYRLRSDRVSERRSVLGSYRQYVEDRGQMHDLQRVVRMVVRIAGTRGRRNQTSKCQTPLLRIDLSLLADETP